ncbi:MAG: LptF/LptG family permease [Candidatus Kapabacteria bacterium]|nr:LptF/LptG family permease [Candidatus Kapabacteria bacterium]
MLLIPRYILRFHIGPFIFGASVVTFLFLLQFIMKYIDLLVSRGLDGFVIVQLIVLNLSWMVVFAVPMGALFSTLMSFGALSATHEIDVIKSGGASLYRMMFPSLIVGCILTIALFWFNDNILPESNHRAKLLLGDIQRKKPTFAIEAGQFSNQIEGYSILARKTDTLTGLLLDVTIYDRTKPYQMNIVTADSGQLRFTADYNQIMLKLSHGEIHQVKQNNYNDFRKITFDFHEIAMSTSGFLLEQSTGDMFSRGDREMRIADMQSIIDKNATERDSSLVRLARFQQAHFDLLVNAELYFSPFIGKDSITLANVTQKKSIVTEKIFEITTTFAQTMESEQRTIEDRENRIKQYLVEIHKKYSLPFACIVFVMVGCPLGISTRKGNFGISAAISLGFYVFFWACLIGGEKLADRGLMSPQLGMWMANIIVAIVGIFLILKINNESFTLKNLIKKLQNIVWQKKNEQSK